MKKRLIACMMLTIIPLNLNIHCIQAKTENTKKVVTTNTNANENGNIHFNVVDPDDKDID